MAVETEEVLLVRVQQENFSIDEEIDRVRSRSTRIGGINIFLGTARDRSKGRDVSSMKFEHYEGMAQKKLREIQGRTWQCTVGGSRDSGSCRCDRDDHRDADF